MRNLDDLFREAEAYTGVSVIQGVAVTDSANGEVYVRVNVDSGEIAEAHDEDEDWIGDTEPEDDGIGDEINEIYDEEADDDGD